MDENTKPSEQNQYQKYLIPGLLAAGVLLVGYFWFWGGKTESELNPSPSPASSDTITDMQDVQKEDLVVGTGEEAVNGKNVTVHYVGTLTDGKKFDSSVDRGTPFTFTIGVGEVIKGWDLGVLGMKVGGKRKLTIPPELGYGAAGAGPDIPPDSTLVFEVELLKVE